MDLQNILIESTAKTPHVDFNHLTGELILSGKSIPEDAVKIYEPLVIWVNQYVNNACITTNLRLNLEYFNTSSALWIAKIVKALCRIKNPEYILFIHLYFHVEDFDSMEEDDLKEAISPVFDTVKDAIISVGVKIYGIDDDGKIIKESMVLI